MCMYVQQYMGALNTRTFSSRLHKKHPSTQNTAHVLIPVLQHSAQDAPSAVLGPQALKAAASNAATAAMQRSGGARKGVQRGRGCGRAGRRGRAVNYGRGHRGNGNGTAEGGGARNRAGAGGLWGTR